MPKILAHRVKKVHNASRHMACRGAVLTSVFGSKWISLGTEKALKDLRSLWHIRLDSLKKSGWVRTPTDKKLNYIKNCPPFSCESADSAQRCDLRLICPFCWARRFVLDPFMRIEKALFGDFISDVPIDVTLIEFTRTYTIFSKDSTWNRQRKIAAVKIAKNIIKTDRQIEAKIFKPVAGVVFHRFEFSKNCCFLTRNGVFLCKLAADFKLPEELELLKRQKKFVGNRWQGRQITKKRLYRIFRNRFRYPASIFQISSTDVIDMLEGLRGTRMLASIGHCRNAKGESDDKLSLEVD